MLVKYLQVTILILLIIGCSGEDKVVTQVIPHLTERTSFVLKKPSYPEGIILQKGKLGKFASCLKAYRGIAHRKPTQKGSLIKYEIWVNEKMFIDASTIKKEVFSFSVRVFKEKDKFYSKTYAVNCDLSLLDAD